VLLKFLDYAVSLTTEHGQPLSLSSELFSTKEMQPEALSTNTETDEHLPLGYRVDDDILKAYARDHGIIETPQINVITTVMSTLDLQIAPPGSQMASRVQPSWNTDATGDFYYLQVSGWEGYPRGAEWRVDEDMERAYCNELGLEFGKGRKHFTPWGQ